MYPPPPPQQDSLSLYEGNRYSPCWINITACSDLGLILHLNGFGWLFDNEMNKTSFFKEKKEETNLTNPVVNSKGGVITFPFSSIALPISIVAIICALINHNDSAEKWRPGQILTPIQFFLKKRENMHMRGVLHAHRRPNPKMTACGSGNSWLPRYRSGMNSFGLSQSCRMALEQQKWKFDRPEEAGTLLDINEHARTCWYNEISICIVFHQTMRHPKWDRNIPSRTHYVLHLISNHQVVPHHLLQYTFQISQGRPIFDRG